MNRSIRLVTGILDAIIFYTNANLKILKNIISKNEKPQKLYFGCNKMQTIFLDVQMSHFKQ